jgi:hypothetical protein
LPLPGGFGQWNWFSSVMRQREFALFSFAFNAFAFFKLDFLRPPSLFFGFASAKARKKREKSAIAHL